MVTEPQSVSGRVLRSLWAATGDVERATFMYHGAKDLHAELSAEARRVLDSCVDHEYAMAIMDLCTHLGLTLTDERPADGEQAEE